MHCFTHRDVPAIAICRNCSRGLCAACMTEFPDGVVCKGHCEARHKEDLQFSNSVRQRHSSLRSRSASTAYISGLWIGGVGLCFIFEGLREIRDTPFHFVTLAGLVMVGGGIYNMLDARRMRRE